MRKLARTLGLRNPVPVARRAAGSVRRRARDWWRGESEETFFDLHDLRGLNRVLVDYARSAPLSPEPRQAETSVAGATRFVLGLLATQPRLRKQFPRALSDGPTGAFCEWLATVGAARLGLTHAAAGHIRAAFAADPGRRVKRVYEFRPDLREVFPFGMTPHPDRMLFLVWLIVHGPDAFGLTPEEALWFHFERNEDRDRGLVPTYLLQPEWQAAVPHGLTLFGWEELKAYLRDRYGVAGRWFDKARLVAPFRPWDDLTLLLQTKPDLTADFPRRETQAGDAAVVLGWIDSHPELPRPHEAWRDRLREDVTARVPSRPGVNVIGHFRYASGLQEAAAGVVTGVTRAGGRTVLRDLPVKFECDWTDKERYQGLELYDTTVYVAAVNTFPAEWMPRAGVLRRPGVKRIAVWYWELEEIPAGWADKIGWPDEVWAPTRFIADTFRKYVDVPVVPMLPGVELPAFGRKPKAYFGLPDDRFTFLFAFDMGSVMARKNPLGLIAAYKAAFRPDDRAHLAIKVSRGESDPASFAALNRAAADAGVTVINTVLTRADTLALLAACDCYVSLHRSEGLGLGMAETMLMGKPVIATNYSGNTDFMTAETGYLVDYKRVPIVDDLPPYPRGCLWADPSVPHAAELMRRVYERPDEAAAVGARAKAALQDLLSMDAYGKRMIARLQNMARG